MWLENLRLHPFYVSILWHRKRVFGGACTILRLRARSKLVFRGLHGISLLLGLYANTLRLDFLAFRLDSLGHSLRSLIARFHALSILFINTDRKGRIRSRV